MPDTAATHREKFVNRLAGEAREHGDAGVYSTVKLRTKVPTLNADYEVEANPSDRPSDTGADYANDGIPGTSATGMGADEDSIISVDGSIITAPRTWWENGIKFTDRVLRDTEGHERIKVIETDNNGVITTEMSERYEDGTMKNYAKRVMKNGNVVTLTLKSYDENGNVVWSLKKTFTLSLLTGELDQTVADLYAGDCDGGGKLVLTENYKRTKKVTTNPIPDADRKWDDAAGTTFYTREYVYSEAEAGYDGTKYIKRPDTANPGQFIYVAVADATDYDPSADTVYKREEVYTAVPRDKYVLGSLADAGTPLFVGEGDAFVSVRVAPKAPATGEVVDPYSYFDYSLGAVPEQSALGATFYTYNDAKGTYEKKDLSSATQLAFYASDAAPDIFVKQIVRGQVTYVNAKLRALEVGFFDDYVYTLEGDKDSPGTLVEHPLDDLTFYVRTETQVPNPDYTPPTEGEDGDKGDGDKGDGSGDGGTGGGTGDG